MNNLYLVFLFNNMIEDIIDTKTDLLINNIKNQIDK